ncbi:hypothetical protein [Micromonospora qiuiae]|uniref:hypothetical protein n=1 Tax=Micromonospora qiuiae TaxID=502268 RepID=UPI00194EA43D|nr:hypothetical protein [Micromonospora qiuiae]
MASELAASCPAIHHRRRRFLVRVAVSSGWPSGRRLELSALDGLDPQRPSGDLFEGHLDASLGCRVDQP